MLYGACAAPAVDQIGECSLWCAPSRRCGGAPGGRALLWEPPDLVSEEQGMWSRGRACSALAWLPVPISHQKSGTPFTTCTDEGLQYSSPLK